MKKMSFWEWIIVIVIFVGIISQAGTDLLFQGIQTQNFRDIAIGLGFLFIVYEITQKK